MVGNGGVGKSSCIRRFCKDTFTDQYKKTIGVDFLEKQQYVPSVGETVTMMVWYVSHPFVLVKSFSFLFLFIFTGCGEERGHTMERRALNFIVFYLYIYFIIIL